MPANEGAMAEEYAATKPVSATKMALLSLSELEGLDAPGRSAGLVLEPQTRGGLVSGQAALGEPGTVYGERGEDMQLLHPDLGVN